MPFLPKGDLQKRNLLSQAAVKGSRMTQACKQVEKTLHSEPTSKRDLGSTLPRPLSGCSQLRSSGWTCSARCQESCSQLKSGCRQDTVTFLWPQCHGWGLQRRLLGLLHKAQGRCWGQGGVCVCVSQSLYRPFSQRRGTVTF